MSDFKKPTPSAQAADILGGILHAAQAAGPLPALPEFIDTIDPDRFMANLVRVARRELLHRPQTAVHGPWAPPRNEREKEDQRYGRVLIDYVINSARRGEITMEGARRRLEGRYLEEVPSLPLKLEGDLL